MNNRSKTIIFTFLLLLSLFASYGGVSAVIVGPNVLFESGNEDYWFPTAMNFSVISHNETWFRVNDTYWNVSSSNDINISISYLDEDFSTASSGDTVLSFSADTTAGTVYFNLTGFKASTTYTLFRDSVAVTTYNSNGDGNLSFTNDVWSSHDFSIKEGDQTGTSSTKQIQVRYDSNSAEDVIDTGFDVFPMMILVSIVMMAVVVISIAVAFRR